MRGKRVTQLSKLTEMPGLVRIPPANLDVFAVLGRGDGDVVIVGEDGSDRVAQVLILCDRALVLPVGVRRVSELAHRHVVVVIEDAVPARRPEKHRCKPCARRDGRRAIGYDPITLAQPVAGVGVTFQI